MPGGSGRIDAANINAAVVQAPPEKPKRAARPYDPGEHTVDEVKAYAAKHPDRLAEIVEVETAGKARTTLLDALSPSEPVE
jgi:hypothetical protein